MVHINEVDRQLKNIGVDIRFWGRAEVRELQHIIMPGEQIKSCINGRYEGGFAVLCATDQRLLLVDKKLMYLSVEDMRYDMVAEVDFHGRLLDSTINICTPSKTLIFTGFKQKPLREMASYIQNRVMEFRQMHMMQDMPQQVPAQGAQAQSSAPIQDTTGQTQPAPPVAAPAQTASIMPTAAAVASDQPATTAPQPLLDDVQLQYQTLPQEDKAVSSVPFIQQLTQPGTQRVNPIRFGAANPYTKVPLMMRRRVGRFGI